MKTFFVVRRMCYVFLVLIISSNIILAQDKEEHKGMYALQFQIGSNFTLGSFLGSVFSGKYNISENDAVRLGISVNANNKNQNSYNEQINPVFTNSNKTSNESNNYGIVLQYLRNIYLKNHLNFYFGGGPSFSYGLDRSTNILMQENNNVNNDYRRYYGITACAGIEWYFSKAMSLSAQYGIAYNYYEEVLNVSYAYNNVQQSSNEVRTTGFQIYPNSVLFGLTVYF